MFTEVAEDCIGKAVDAEVSQAKTLYGERYASDHEGWAVLKEEIEEAVSDLGVVSQKFTDCWKKIRENESVDSDLVSIIIYSKLLALEAIQICAVATKWRNK